MADPKPIIPEPNWELGGHTVHRHDSAGHAHLQQAENYFYELVIAEATNSSGKTTIDTQWLRWRVAHHRQMATLHFTAARVHPEWTEHSS